MLRTLRALQSVPVRVTVAVVVTAAFMALPVGAAGAETLVPPGFRVVEGTQVGPGVEYLKLAGTERRQSVNVARIAPDSPTSLRAVLSDDHVADPGVNLERTSSMCERVDCLVAVNGDFYDLENGQPQGGVVVGGELVRSPSPVHHQLVVSPEGRLSARTLGWTGRIESTDLKPLSLDAVNIPRGADQLVLYTPAYGASTGTNPFGTELTAAVETPGRILLDQTVVLRLGELRRNAGDTAIAPGTVVLSGHGRAAEALHELWARVQKGVAGTQLLLRIESDQPAGQSLGGTPILVRDGKRWGEGPGSFGADRHPRTIVGWTAAGEVLLVTVDGRQPGFSEGMTLGEAADLMIRLGAVEAINLDGGGSTTFVVKGAVANQPSDRLVRRKGREAIVHSPGRGEMVLGNVERPVAVGLALVPGTPAQVGPQPDLGLDVPKPLSLASPAARDPASEPDGSVPGIVNRLTGAEEGGFDSLEASLAANVALALVVGALLRRRFGRRGDPTPD
ncbi:MAG: phosphodiester glycosidase family protein [Actinomycetota bacterium]